MWLEKRPCTWPKASWRPAKRPCFDAYITSPLCHQCLHYEQKDVRLPAATTMIIKFLSGKKTIMYMAKISIIIEKSIIIDFFQSPISIIIEKINIHFNNY